MIELAERGHATTQAIDTTEYMMKLLRDDAYAWHHVPRNPTPDKVVSARAQSTAPSWFVGEQGNVQIHYSFVPTLFIAGHNREGDVFSPEYVLYQVGQFLQPWASLSEFNVGFLGPGETPVVGWQATGNETLLLHSLRARADQIYGVAPETSTHVTVATDLASTDESQSWWELYESEEDYQPHLIPPLAEPREALFSDDWDGQGSPAYDREVFRRANVVYQELAHMVLDQAGRVVPTPAVGPGPKGSVDLHWLTDQFELLINIPSDPEEPLPYYGDDFGVEKVKGTIVPGAPSSFLAAWFAAA